MKFLSNINENKKSLNKKLKIGALVLLPFISIAIVIVFRHTFTPTNEEILESLKNMKNYNSILEYTINNTRGEYKNKAHINYCEEEGIRLDFGDELTKIYKDDSIIMKYNQKDEEYEVSRDLDVVYPMAAMKEVLKNPIVSVEEGQQEWGDLKYLKVELDLVDINKHLDRATLYVNKKEKSPMLIKMYDDKGDERVNIEYREFNKKDVCKSKES